ncbi:MAG: translesion DNA synthesis-associated protein ImuA [Steroidobacteraceae bacterium]
MSGAAHHAGLEALLQHPALWRGGNAAVREAYPTGFAALDAVFPGGGWPRRGLVEVLTPAPGCGELRLWAPLVAHLTQAPEARWCAFVAPPFEPFAPAWQACGARTDRLLVVRGAQPAWSMEQGLLSGACALVFGWIARLTMHQLRRLALAAEKGAALGVLIRPPGAQREHSTAVLRLALEGTGQKPLLRLLKGRGVMPQRLDVDLAPS